MAVARCTGPYFRFEYVKFDVGDRFAHTVWGTGTMKRMPASMPTTDRGGAGGSREAGDLPAAERRKVALVVDRDPEGARWLSECLTPQLDVQVATTAVRAAVLLEELPRVDLAFIDL